MVVVEDVVGDEEDVVIKFDGEEGVVFVSEEEVISSKVLDDLSSVVVMMGCFFDLEKEPDGA